MSKLLRTGFCAMAGVFLALPVLSHAQVIDTVAGGEIGDGGPAAAAALAFPRYLARDASGNLLISDSLHNRIRMVDAAGTITTIAGGAGSGFSGDGGPAADAKLNVPAGIIFDASGNLLIADEGNNVVRQIDSNGIVTTFAGTGQRGFSGDGGPASMATFRCPFGLAFDAAGNLFVVDTSNHAIRRIDPLGIIRTVAGNGTPGFSGDGGSAAAAQLRFPRSIVIDSSGNLFIADTANHRIRKVDSNGIISTFAGDGSSAFFGDGGLAVNAGVGNPRGVALDSSGNLLITSRGRVRQVDPSGIISTLAGSSDGFNGDGNPPLSTSFAGLTEPFQDTNGDLLLADSANGRIRRIAGGVVSTVAGGFLGDGNPATAANFNQPRGIALDAQERLYIADERHHRIRRVDQNGIIQTIAGTGISGVGPDGGSSAVMTDIFFPLSVGLDTSGNVYFGDSFVAIRKVDNSGILTTVAGNGSFGFSGDGGPAIQASITVASSIQFDPAGNLLFSDSFNCVVRRIDSAGIITTVAGNGTCGFAGDGGPATSAQLNFPFGIAFDAAGSLYVADSQNHRIRKIDSAGVISTFAGDGVCGVSGDEGLAVTARLCSPRGVSADSAGNVFIADFDNFRVRRVDSSGIITTVAGMGDGTDFTGFGDGGDGGPATQALMQNPESLAVDLSGNLYISDLFIYRIRKITFDPAQVLQDVQDGLQELIEANPGSRLADKLENVLSKVESALQELGEEDPRGAVVKLKVAAHLLEVVVNDGLLDPSLAAPLFNKMVSAARILAEDAINEAISGGGDPAKIAKAQDLLSEGDALALNMEFESAISSYSDSLSKAESAL